MRVLLVFVVLLFACTKANFEQLVRENPDQFVNSGTPTSVGEGNVITVTSSPDVGSDIPAHISSVEMKPQSMTETLSSWYKPIDFKDCTLQGHCPDDKACVNHMCIDPCQYHCGSNTECSVIDHRAMCTCKPGYKGDPQAGCLKVDVCNKNECSVHDQCPATKSCIMGKCSDPCQYLCAPNTNCTVFNHVPACACKDGYSGNPFKECKLQVCSGSWPPFPHAKKKYYVETSITVDWMGAFVHCIAKGYRLAAIENKEELEDIREALRKTNIRQKEFWISGSDKAYKGRWLWATTGKVVTVFDWHGKEPNNAKGTEDCLELEERDKNYGYKYNDEKCDLARLFICEYYDSL